MAPNPRKSVSLPPVSVALCTYNGERFLLEQLESLVSQTHRPAEIVVCDDRSTDGTCALVEAFRSRCATPVRLVVNELQLGYRANFMKAARLCGSELVAFCDQDDIWLPQKLERCARCFADPTVMLVMHEAMICGSDGTATDETLYRSVRNSAMSAFLGRGPMVPWPNVQGFTQVFRRSLLDDRSIDGITDHYTGQTLAHDQIALLAAVDRGRVTCIEEPLALYRQHGNNVVGFRRCQLRATIYRLLVNRTIRLLPFAKAARDRAAFLGRGRGLGLPAGIYAHAAFVAKYERLATIYQLRAALYAESRLRERWRILRSLVALRAYGTGMEWSFAASSKWQDYLFGLLLRPLLVDPKAARTLGGKPKWLQLPHR